jgi:hypothetical protein
MAAFRDKKKDTMKPMNMHQSSLDANMPPSPMKFGGGGMDTQYTGNKCGGEGKLDIHSEQLKSLRGTEDSRGRAHVAGKTGKAIVTPHQPATIQRPRSRG